MDGEAGKSGENNKFANYLHVDFDMRYTYMY